MNKLTLLLKKGVYLCKYMDRWSNYYETSLSNKENFYSNLNLEDISKTGFEHAENVCSTFEMHSGDYNNFRVQSNHGVLEGSPHKICAHSAQGFFYTFVRHNYCIQSSAHGFLKKIIRNG